MLVASLVAVVPTVVAAQDGDGEEPAAEPAPEATPPVTAVPGDPLVAEGASDELDPNTPVDPDASPSDEAPECAESDGPAASDGEIACDPVARGRYANQPEFVPDRLNRREVRRVERALVEARNEHVLNVSRVRALRLRKKQLDIERLALSEQTAATLEALIATEEKMRKRALATFVETDNFQLAPSLDHDDLMRFQQQSFLVGEVLSLDRDLLDEYTRLRKRLAAETLELYESLNAVGGWLRDANTTADESATAIGDLEFELATWNNRSAGFIPDVVFPLDGDYDLPLINSWGYPRAPGTIDQHWHEGIDLFAPRGTPIVAAESGEITDIGVGVLGGLKVWVLGDSGTRWYYAHLGSFNPHIEIGDRLSAGALIGYVGTTGNAVGTPPHLHLQMHPDGGRPVNPYPILQAASDRYQNGFRPNRPRLDANLIEVLPNGSRRPQPLIEPAVPIDSRRSSDPAGVEAALVQPIAPVVASGVLGSP